MNASDPCNKDIDPPRESFGNGQKRKNQGSSRQFLKSKFDRENKLNKDLNAGHSYGLERSSCSSWCDAISLSAPNVNAKQAWKSGTEKLSQTLNNVRSTFGTLSRKIKKSTNRRQPLINLDSPSTPVTPYTKSKALLGRTPIKLYSPFHIDSPRDKENVFSRNFAEKRNSRKESIRSINRKFKEALVHPSVQKNGSSTVTSEVKLSEDLLQTQIGIYEFQSVANRIVQKEKKP